MQYRCAKARFCLRQYFGTELFQTWQKDNASFIRCPYYFSHDFSRTDGRNRRDFQKHPAGTAAPDRTVFLCAGLCRFGKIDVLPARTERRKEPSFARIKLGKEFDVLQTAIMDVRP